VNEENVMPVVGQEKKDLITKYKIHESDSGSSEVQVAILTKRIDSLTQHFETHKKDHASRRGLIKLVSKRRRLLEYLKTHHTDRYAKLIGDLGLRK
jgi:small subunit ribosomal protein S15